MRIEITEMQKRVDKPKVRLKWPRGKTFTCAWCGDRLDSIKDHNGLFEKDTGKPVCGACEGTL